MQSIDEEMLEYIANFLVRASLLLGVFTYIELQDSGG